jgi:pseudaminic acid biosynthesis-associated methylase
MKDNTAQGELWKDRNWGKDYMRRNDSQEIFSSNLSLFATIFKSIPNRLASVMEVGPNIGLNIDAIHFLSPETSIDCIEINDEACEYLRSKKYIKNVINKSILEIQHTKDSYDLVFTKGVLIHIHPDFLDDVYEKLYSMSKSFVMFAEYYNPNPVSLTYRGKKDVLFKRDFAGDFIKKYPGSELIDYGFVYHGDKKFPQDDITWFLIKIAK